MKKSSTLMLSYIIFLLVTVLIRFCFEWTGLWKIALAATIAGCFFAFADLASWYISHKRPLVEAMKEDLTVFKQFADTAIAHIQRDIENSKEAIDIVKIYSYEEKYTSEFVGFCETSALHFQQMIEEIEKCKSDVVGTEVMLNKDTTKLVGIGIIEAVFAICGFFAFFILICFNAIANIVITCGDAVTVLAFAIIMLNYFLRDVLGEYAKKDLADINKHIQQEKSNIEEMNAKMTEIKYIELANKIVDQIEADKITGGPDNG